MCAYKIILRKEVVNAQESWDSPGIRSYEYGSSKDQRSKSVFPIKVIAESWRAFNSFGHKLKKKILNNKKDAEINTKRAFPIAVKSD